MVNQPKAIVLGGTNAHIALIENLQRRGYYTILVDYLDNPPAKKAADEHIKESTLDKDKVLETAQKTGTQLVISTCVDQANVIACYVAEKLGLPSPYSYETAINVADKTKMKKIMSEGGIPTAKYLYVEGSLDFDYSKLKMPVVVKPADNNGSKGVKHANDLIEIKKYLKDALQLSRSNKAIIEEYVEGIEIGMDCFIQNKQAHIIMMHQKRKPVNDGSSVIYSIGSLSPPNINSTIKQKLQQIANKIADVFQLEQTSLIIQAIVNGDNVNVVEFAPRIGGGLNFRTIKLFTGFDILNATVDSYLGLPTNVEYKHPDFYHSENHVYTFPGIFGEITGHDYLLEQNIIEEFYFSKTKGMEIRSDMASRDRAASFFVKANTKQDLTQKIRLAMDRLQVFDINGNPIMRKDIYEDLLLY